MDQNLNEDIRQKLFVKDECEIIICNALQIEHHYENKPNKLIKNFKIEHASEDTIGFLGEYYKLIIQTSADDHDWCFFVKSLPILKEEERKLIMSYGVFEKEAALYETVLKELSTFSKIKWLPKCYYTRSDIIVLENLIEQDCFHVSEKDQFTEEHLKACLRSLALMHASSIAYEIKHQKNIGKEFESILFEVSIARDNIWYLSGIRCLQSVALRHPKYQSITDQEFISKYFFTKLDSVCDMVNTSNVFRNVLCHRDPWRKNILFKNENHHSIQSNDYDNNNNNGDNNNTNLLCILIDFQICTYCPPAIDVLFSIFLNTPRKLREKIFSKSLNWYYNYLSSELNRLKINSNYHITREEFLNSCKAFELWPVLYNAIAATIIDLPKNVLCNLRKNYPEKYKNFSVGDRSEVILEYLEKDEKFRDHLFDLVEDLLLVLYKM